MHVCCVYRYIKIKDWLAFACTYFVCFYFLMNCEIYMLESCLVSEIYLLDDFDAELNSVGNGGTGLVGCW